MHSMAVQVTLTTPDSPITIGRTTTIADARGDASINRGSVDRPPPPLATLGSMIVVFTTSRGDPTTANVIDTPPAPAPLDIISLG